MILTGYRQQIGRRGEMLAERHLVARGYRILEANYRGKQGEIDRVAEKDGALVFVEVRTRKAGGFGSPEESITERKRARMISVAEEYLQAHEAEESEWRIDVVAVELRPSGTPFRVEVIENAVER